MRFASGFPRLCWPNRDTVAGGAGYDIDSQHEQEEQNHQRGESKQDPENLSGKRFAERIANQSEGDHGLFFLHRSNEHFFQGAGGRRQRFDFALLRPQQIHGGVDQFAAWELKVDQAVARSHRCCFGAQFLR